MAILFLIFLVDLEVHFYVKNVSKNMMVLWLRCFKNIKNKYLYSDRHTESKECYCKTLSNVDLSERASDPPYLQQHASHPVTCYLSDHHVTHGNYQLAGSFLVVTATTIFRAS
jgi:hypothetical protein